MATGIQSRTEWCLSLFTRPTSQDGSKVSFSEAKSLEKAGVRELSEVVGTRGSEERLRETAIGVTNTLRKAAESATSKHEKKELLNFVDLQIPQIVDRAIAAAVPDGAKPIAVGSKVYPDQAEPRVLGREPHEIAFKVPLAEDLGTVYQEGKKNGQLNPKWRGLFSKAAMNRVLEEISMIHAYDMSMAEAAHSRFFEASKVYDYAGEHVGFELRFRLYGHVDGGTVYLSKDKQRASAGV